MQFLPILFCLSMLGSCLVGASPPRLSGLETIQQEPPVQSEPSDENPESELQKSESEEPIPESDNGNGAGPIVEENDPSGQMEKPESGAPYEEQLESELSEDSDNGAGPAEPELSEDSDDGAGPAEPELSEDSDNGAWPAEPELSEDSDDGAGPAEEEDEQVAEPPADIDGGDDDEPVSEEDEDEQQDEVQVQQPRQASASCCPEGFKQFRDNCYIGIKSPPKAFKAVPSECAKLGADFASIHSRAEYAWVKRHYDLNKYWIGVVAYADGHRENEDGTDTDFQAFDDPVWDPREKHPYICKVTANCDEEM